MRGNSDIVAQSIARTAETGYANRLLCGLSLSHEPLVPETSGAQDDLQMLVLGCRDESESLEKGPPAKQCNSWYLSSMDLFGGSSLIHFKSRAYLCCGLDLNQHTLSGTSPSNWH